MKVYDLLYRYRHNSRKKSVFFFWLFSYALILIIPVFFSGVVYFISSREINDEINRSGIAMLKQMQVAIDSTLSEAQRLSINLTNNKKVLKVASFRKPLENAEKYAITELLMDLKGYNTTNQCIKSFYIYFKGMDNIVSPVTAGDSRAMYEALGHQGLIPFDEWHDLLQEQHTMHCISISSEDEDGKSSKMVAFLQSIPINAPLQPQGTVVVLIEENELMKMAKSIHGANAGDVLIINKNNEILASTRSFERESLPSFDELQGESGVIQLELEGKKVSMFYNTSEISKLKYIELVPRSVVNARITKIKIIMFASILLCLLIGGGTAIYLAIRNYNPIRNLLKFLGDNNKTIVTNHQHNEYRIIQEFLSSSMLEKDRLIKKIGEQNLSFRTSYIEKLLKGKIEHKENTLDILSSMGINLYSEYFAVILVYIDDFGDIFSSIDEEDFERTLETVKFVFKNVMEEISSQNQLGIMIEVDDMMACLVNFKPEGIQNAKEELKRIAGESQSFISDKFHISFTVSISNVHHMISGIHEAWEEANEAMEHRLIEGSRKLIQYQDKVPSHNLYFYPLEMEYKLVNCIKAGDSTAALDIINKIFEENLTKEVLSIKMAKCLMYDLISTVVKIAEELSSTYRISLLEETDIIGNLMDCKSLPSIKELLISIILQACEEIHDGKRSVNYSMGDRIADYINNNYDNINLGLFNIAENFEITPAYVSRIFKEQMGEGILDYINKLRLARAKELLKEGGFNISAIAEKVGYAESRSLIRLFKKYEGITPGKYKEI